MPSSQSVYMVVPLAFVALMLVVSFGLTVWGRVVARRRGTTIWRRLAWLPMGAFVLAAFGAYLFVTDLRGLFSNIDRVPPELRAQTFSNGIANAMNLGGALVIAAFTVYMVSVVVFIAGSLRPPAS